MLSVPNRGIDSTVEEPDPEVEHFETKGMQVESIIIAYVLFLKIFIKYVLPVQTSLLISS